MNKRTLLRCALAAGTVGLAGCTGGDGGDTDGASPDATATPTSLPTATPEPTEPSPTGEEPTDTPTETERRTDSPTAESTDSPTPMAGADQQVVVGPDGSLQFDPEAFTVAAGDTVEWVWDSSGHNVSPDEGGQPADADWSGDDDATYGQGYRYAYTFEVAGEYRYHCDPHRSVGMTGSFTVEQ